MFLLPLSSERSVTWVYRPNRVCMNGQRGAYSNQKVTWRSSSRSETSSTRLGRIMNSSQLVVRLSAHYDGFCRAASASVDFTLIEYLTSAYEVYQFTEPRSIDYVETHIVYPFRAQIGDKSTIRPVS